MVLICISPGLIMSTFSCTYWPFIHLLSRNVCTGSSSFLPWATCCLVTKFVGVFCMLTYCQIHGLHIFFPFYSLSLHSLDCILWCIWSFIDPICLCLLFLLELSYHSQEIITRSMDVWVAQSVSIWLNLSSGLDLRVVSSSPMLGSLLDLKPA